MPFSFSFSASYRTNLLLLLQYQACIHKTCQQPATMKRLQLGAVALFGFLPLVQADNNALQRLIRSSPRRKDAHRYRIFATRHHHQALLQRGGHTDYYTSNNNNPTDLSLLLSSLEDAMPIAAIERRRGGSTAPSDRKMRQLRQTIHKINNRRNNNPPTKSPPTTKHPIPPPPSLPPTNATKMSGTPKEQVMIHTSNDNLQHKRPAKRKLTIRPPPPPNRTKIAGIPTEQLFMIGSSAALVVTASVVAYGSREVLRPILDKQYILEHTLTLLRRLDEGHPSWNVSIFYISAIMAVWEFLGLTTIPMEVAAGMVFGWRRGAVASGAGKILGAFGAFWVGRNFLSGFVRTKLSQNPVWVTIDQSIQGRSPLMVACLMKVSCFPKLIKNVGSSCLEMPFAAFAVLTCGHGAMYTAVWTWLGADAAKRLKVPGMPANILLQVTLVVTALVGFVGSPLLMAWWIRDMTKRYGEMQQGKSMVAAIPFTVP